MSESEPKADRPSLFVFAHQDDEIAYMGMLAKMARDGSRVHMIWITDGAFSVPAEVRRRESLAALEIVGLGGDRAFDFWDYPDGHALLFAGEIVGRLTSVMLEIGPPRVFTVAYEGGHPDHDLAHFAAVKAAKELCEAPLVFEAPLYNSHGCRLGRFGELIGAETPTMYTELDFRDRLAKTRAMLEYSSQLWIAILPALALGGTRAMRRREPYRQVPERDYLKPPHPGKLLYENAVFSRMLDTSFGDFRRAVLEVAGEGRVAR